MGKDTTTATVSETPTSVTYGNEGASVFTVGVSTGHGEAVPNGDSFTVNAGSASCSVTLPATTCSIGNTSLSVSGGAYAVSATFNGDTDLSTSTGNAATGLTVGKDTTTATVSETPTSVTYCNEGASVLTATVTTGITSPPGHRVGHHQRGLDQLHRLLGSRRQRRIGHLLHRQHGSRGVRYRLHGHLHLRR